MRIYKEDQLQEAISEISDAVRSGHVVTYQVDGKD